MTANAVPAAASRSTAASREVRTPRRFTNPIRRMVDIAPLQLVASPRSSEHHPPEGSSVVTRVTCAQNAYLQVFRHLPATRVEQDQRPLEAAAAGVIARSRRHGPRTTLLSCSS